MGMFTATYRFDPGHYYVDPLGEGELFDISVTVTQEEGLYVLFVDELNLAKYQQREPFNARGPGKVRRFAARVQLPHGRWWMILENRGTKPVDVAIDTHF